MVAGATPRYGMCVMNVPVRTLNNSKTRWFTPPAPAEP